MEFMHWLLLGSFIICTASLYFGFHPKYYDPNKVLVDMGDQVFISHLPIAKMHKKYGKTVSKSYIAKIQLAGSYVTLFSSSGNAIDIWAPKDQFAESIFDRAKNIFTNAEAVVVARQ
jgi:hypothetical protein